MAGLLNWANSIKRQFREAARRSAFPGWTLSASEADLYADIARLLAVPGGLSHLEHLVEAADEVKHRGLIRALERRAIALLGEENERDDTAAKIRTLWREGEVDLAAWLAFEDLAWASRPDLADEDVVTLLKADDDLRAALGDYWTDWLAQTGEDQAEEKSDPAAAVRHSMAEAASDARVVTPSDESVDDDLKADRGAWAAALTRLRAELDSAEEFSAILIERLVLGADDLRPLAERAVARSARTTTRLCELASEHVERLAGALAALDRSVAWGEGVVGAAARLNPDQEGVETLKSCADWAEDLLRQTHAAEGRRRAALDRAGADDSDEAVQELAGANAERRRLWQEIDSQAAGWLDRLLPALDPVVRAGGQSDRESLKHEIMDAPEPGAADDERESVESSRLVEDTIDGALRDAATPRGQTPGSDEAGRPAPPELAPSVVGVLADLETGEEKLDPAPPGEPVAKAPMVREDVIEPEDEAVVRPEETTAVYSQLVRRALDEGRYGLAAHLQRAVEVVSADPCSGAIESPVLEALCIGSSITVSRLGPAESRYDSVLDKVLASLAGASQAPESVRLLAFAGAIKPALFSAQTSAAEAIRAAAVGNLGPNLHALTEFVVEQLPKRGGTIDLASLSARSEEQGSADDLEPLRAALVEMADGAPARKAVFQRATIIWRDLFVRDVAVSRAIAALRQNAPNAGALAQLAGEELEHHLERKVRELDRAAKRNRDGWLEGKALEWLLGLLRELTDLLVAYAAVARRAAAPKSTHTAETKRILVGLVAAAITDLEKCAQREFLSVPARSAARVLGEVAALLQGKPNSTLADLTVDALLDGDLLLIEPYPAEARRRELTVQSALRLLSGAEAVLGRSPDFAAAFKSLLDAGRFEEAAQAGDRLGRQGDDRDRLAQEIADARLERLDRVAARATRLRGQLDDLLGADTEGRIDPAGLVQLEWLEARLTSSEHQAEVLQGTDFPAVEVELDGLETKIRDGSDLLLAPLQREIHALEAAGCPVQLLQDLAAKGELTALRECMNGVKAGAEIDLAGYQEKLLRRFADPFLSPGFAQTDPKLRNVAELLQAAKEQRRAGLVDFSILPDGDVQVAEGLLSAWLKLKRAGEESPALRDLLAELRLGKVKITAERPLPSGRRYSVTCDPTRDRGDCPVPAFGSASNGRLEVIVVEAVSVTNGVELYGLVKSLENSTTVPSLVIVKGMLPSGRRIQFMKEARRHAATVPCALLDEVGILFLASWPGRRRSDFFAIALPSGGVQPYSDASGGTSPEMFFGRSTELAELWRADGSCLVFGGRQLGKTALLEQVRLRHHRPPDQIVVYGSLQGDTDLWRMAGRLLSEATVNIKGHSGAAVEAGIREWLGQDEARRILVLVDEADTYLEAEMQSGYRSLAKVRDLMQSTGRRCKFVFAGLHNVQRLARAPNSPLLHFGTPLRIGPLFGQDLGEAREMVVGPMAAAGIVFENPTLPSRILSAVGFYPSLLQTFGTTLIDRVNKSANGRLTPSSLLPIVVTEHDVENALEDPYFKENIRFKFRMTLSLDERYRLITLAMLQRFLDRREQASVAPSLTDVEVQALAREWWPQGFEEDSSLDAFQGLLQEMVGLGVLVASGDRYAIRSSRIAAMLGGEDQIVQELVDLSASPGPAKLDTGSLRRLDKNTKAPSPLTSRQEAQLLGPAGAVPSVHLALGSSALGLDRVAPSLSELQDDELAIRTGTYRTARGFAEQLSTAVERLRAGRRNLLVITGPWLGREMVDLALDAATRRGGRIGTLRVLIAPTRIDWASVDEVDEHDRLWGADLLSLSTLGRSGLAQWLRARGASETLHDELRILTGGYPLFLSGLGRSADILESAKEAHDGHVAAPATLTALGLYDERLQAAARIVAQYESDDPAADLKSMGFERAEKVVGHLERLGILERTPGRDGTRLTLNPFVATVLSQHS
ncbi:MAG TPA: ATP-binding protein [Caulobacteraceae bacterium]